MDIKDIKALYRFLKTTDIVEFELEDSRGKVKMRLLQAAEGAPETRALPKPSEGGKKEETREELKSNLKTITSPMVGTFYRSSAPEAESFVEAGSEVKTGQVVCIIEAMKIMNEVESEYTGRVVAVLVENGQPVEYGEPLFNIEI
ncbi:MAG: acetyl-CoA carboxylase biotin carboxyl carrier protein [Deltaproteobacteria bacterium]|nr:acetyl-CoA carboxylase biotin carboxyl carrier protein [Deltaproteobacteria bacterium]